MSINQNERREPVSKNSELFLRVREADEADYGKSVVRIHRTDRPPDISFGDHVNISLDKKNWANCKLEPAGDIGADKIYIDVRMRKLLNDNVFGVPLAQVGVPCTLYIKKASAWKPILFIIAGAAIIVLAFMANALGLISC